MSGRVEVWRPVPGYEGIYEVSDAGSVRSFCHGYGRMLKPIHDQDGYSRVGLYRNGKQRRVFIHRLVAEAFIGPPPAGLHVAHRDGSRTNNSASNLRYATAAENNADKVAHGRVSHGERNGSAVLTASQVLAIRRFNGPTAHAARLFGIGKTQARAIRARLSWTHLED